jgi:hypothetical protein
MRASTVTCEYTILCVCSGLCAYLGIQVGCLFGYPGWVLIWVSRLCVQAYVYVKLLASRGEK